MTSSRSSKATTLALLVVVVLAAVAPVAAVSVDDANTDVVSEAEAGTQVSSTIVLTELFRGNDWDPWTLEGQTELRNVTWSLTFTDQTGNEFESRTYNGQRLNGGDGVEISTADNVDEIRIEIVGEAPRPNAFTYPEEETFTVASLTQRSGEQGAFDEIGDWEAQHYTTADEQGNAGSQEAREAMANAEAAIAEAEAAGADTTAANQSLSNAIEFYESGDFNNAVKNARTAKQEADDARADVESSEETQQLLLFGGGAVLVIALLGGGVWYYRQQQDDYDKLG